MLIFSVLAMPAFAAILSRDVRPFLYGVDPNGNPSAQIGTVGYGKIYKETTTNILVSVGAAVIINRSNNSAVFDDQGGVLKDPFNNNTYPITSDQQIVSRPFLGLSASTITQVYNPLDL